MITTTTATKDRNPKPPPTKLAIIMATTSEQTVKMIRPMVQRLKAVREAVQQSVASLWARWTRVGTRLATGATTTAGVVYGVCRWTGVGTRLATSGSTTAGVVGVCRWTGVGTRLTTSGLITAGVVGVEDEDSSRISGSRPSYIIQSVRVLLGHSRNILFEVFLYVTYRPPAELSSLSSLKHFHPSSWSSNWLATEIVN